MNHLQKIFEINKFNTNTLKRFITDRDRIYNLIKEFTIIEDLFEFENNKQTIIDIYFEKNVSEVGDEVLIVTVSDYIHEIESYLIGDLYTLYKFMEDPEKYKKSKLYNL